MLPPMLPAFWKCKGLAGTQGNLPSALEYAKCWYQPSSTFHNLPKCNIARLCCV